MLSCQVASAVHNRFVAIELMTSVAVEMCSSLRARNEMELKQEAGKGHCGAGFLRSPPIISGNLNTNTEVTLVSLGGIQKKSRKLQCRHCLSSPDNCFYSE